MLDRIIGFSVNNKLLVGLFTLGLIIYGAYQVTQLPIDAVPDITNNQVQVISVAPSLGATDIERLVTFPIEQATSNIPGIEEIRSFSRFGLSLVTIVFEEDVDVYWARQQVSERLQKVQTEIPPGIATPELGPVTTGLGEIYQYVIRPKPGYEHKYNSTDLRTIQDWIVRRQLLGVKGVADVSSFGGHLKQYEIAIKPEKLRTLGVTIQELYEAIYANNSNAGGAYIEKGPSVLYIRSEGLVNTVDDIENIMVRLLDNGSPILVGDVADVKLGAAPRYGALSYNDKGEVSGAVVMMLKGENSNKVIKNVKERIEDIRKTLPEGLLLEPFLDRTKMVNNAISTVEKNLLEGALIVVFILVLFLGNLRAGLIVASVIPLSMLFAVILMNLFGVSGNLMSLGALDFGLIVDGAVIIVEAVMHTVFSNKAYSGLAGITREQMGQEVQKSSSRMMNSAIFGQIIILIVYLPIFSLQGIEGKMFKPMAQTVSFALIGAFILSLTYIPMMSAAFLSLKTKHKSNLSDKMMASVESMYERLLSKVIRRKGLVITVSLTLFVISIFMLSRMGGEFIPALEEGDFALETRVLPGSNLNVSLKAAHDASKILINKFPEVEKVVSKIGSGEVPTDPMPIDAQDLMIILKDKKEWTSAETFDELAEKMSVELKQIPGVSFGFQYPVQMRFNELMTGAKQDIVCKLFGEDLDSLARYAAQIGEIARTVEGADGIYVEPIGGIPEILVEYDRKAIAYYGLDIEKVNNVISTAFAGQKAGLVFEGEKRFDLVLRLHEDERRRIDDVRNLLVPTSNGVAVPLYLLASVNERLGPNQIQREDAKRRIIVGFNVRGRDMESMVDELRSKIEKKVKLPSGYFVNYGGAFENLNEAKKRLFVAVPIALLLIFLMLYFAFSSARLGLLIFSAIPLSAIGGIFGLYARGLPFSISAGIGFIALFGVAVLNGIVLVAEFKRLNLEINDPEEVVRIGTLGRLRPVLMTALVASLGFLPMALSNGAGAEVQRPLATVVIGGLLVATFLTLFLLPVLYVLFIKNNVKSKNMSKIISLLAFLILLTDASAQGRIGLNQALDSCAQNNLKLRNEKLQIEMDGYLAKTGFDPSKTELVLELGQINSFYSDNRFAIIQNFNFPSVYARNKAFLSQNVKISSNAYDQSLIELKGKVRKDFYYLIYLDEKEELLMEMDSMLQEIVRKTELKMKLGSTDAIEQSGAKNQMLQVRLQLEQLRNDRKIVALRLQMAMNTAVMWLPGSDSLKYDWQLMDSSLNQSHPMLSGLWSQTKLMDAKLSLERSKFMPDLIFGYSNMSMKGFGADNQFYTGSTRFQSIQLGVGLPLFNAATQNNKVKSLEIEREIAANDFKAGLMAFQLSWTQMLSEYQRLKNAIFIYESEVLPNAEKLRSAAQEKLEKGEIAYLEWSVLISQYLTYKSNYLELINSYNQKLIDIQYMSGN